MFNGGISKSQTRRPRAKLSKASEGKLLKAIATTGAGKHADSGPMETRGEEHGCHTIMAGAPSGRMIPFWSRAIDGRWGQATGDIETPQSPQKHPRVGQGRLRRAREDWLWHQRITRLLHIGGPRIKALRGALSHRDGPKQGAGRALTRDAVWSEGERLATPPP